MPGPDRRDRRRVPRVPARRASEQALAPRPRDRRAVRRGRDAAVAAGRGAAGAQGRVHHHGHADHRAARRSSRAGRRRTTRPSPRGCGPPASRSWARPTWTSSRWAPPPRTRAYGPTRNPWNVDRVPGGSGGGSAAALAAFQAPLAIGIRHRRLDPPARRADRDGRGEAHLRHGVALRPDRLRVVAGPGRPVRAHGAGHRAAARGDRRARPDGLHLRRRRGARRGRRGRAGADGDLKGVRIGVVKQLARRGLPGRGARVVQRRGRAADRAGRRGRRGRLPALRLLAGGVLPDPAVGGVVEPGPLRRDALRAAGRRRRHAQRRGGDGADPGRRLRPRSQAPHHDRHRTRCRRATTTPTTTRRRRSAR